MNKFRHCILLVVALVSLAGSSTAASSDEKPDFERDLEPILLQYIEAFQVTGAAVGIVMDGEIVYAKGFGVKSLATGEPVTTRSPPGVHTGALLIPSNVNRRRLRRSRS